MSKNQFNSTDFRINKLLNSDHLRFGDFSVMLQQEVSIHKAAPYLQTDAITGFPSYISTDPAQFKAQLTAAEARYHSATNLRLQESNLNMRYQVSGLINDFNQLGIVRQQLFLFNYQDFEEKNMQFLTTCVYTLIDRDYESIKNSIFVVPKGCRP